MAKNHMKRITAPKTWNVRRKIAKFITKPFPGAHKLDQALSINTFLKEVVNLTHTTKETKYVLTNSEVLVNGRRRRDFKTPVGFLDIISIKSLNKYFVVLVDNKGAIMGKELDEKQASSRLLKISGKSILGKDKVQLNTIGGENLIMSAAEAKKYAVSDSLLVDVASLKILTHIPLKDKALVFVYKGKHSSKSGNVDAVKQRTVSIKSDKESFETSEEYIIAVNKEKIAEFE